MSDERPLKIIDTGGVKTLASFTDADALMWGGGAAIPSSDDVVLEDELFIGGLIDPALLPPLAVSQPFHVASAAAMTALTAQRGDIAIRTDEGKTYVLSSDSPTVLSDWWELVTAGSSAVLSVNGNTGVVVITAAGLGAVQAANTGAATLSATTDITLTADSDANGSGAVILKTGGSAKFTVTNTGVLQAGTASVTGAAPGAIVIPNAVSLWGANAANSAPYRLISVDATDVVRVDQDGRGTQFGGPIGSGSAPLTYRNFNLTATLTGNIAQVGIWAHPTVDSGATTAATAIDVRVIAQAGSYTIADVYGIHILGTNLGAGVTATRNTALLIDSQTAGTTNTAIQTTGAARCNFGGGVTVGATSAQTATLYVAQGASATSAAVFVKYGATPGAGGNGLTIVKSDGTTNVLQVTDKYSVVIGNAALSTSATDGFLYIAASAGAPTGVPTAFTGRVAVEYDTTNDTLNVYNGAWKVFTAGVAGGADNVSTTGVYFNVDSDNNDGTNADNFIWGRDRAVTTGGTELMRLNASGYLLLGTTVTTNVNAFDIVIPNAASLRGVVAAGGDTKAMIALDSTNTVLLGNSGNVRVQSGVFLVNTTVTTSANSGDIVTAFSRGLRILNSGSTTAYLAIDRTTIGTSQCIRIDASALGPVCIGNPGYVDTAAAGDLVLQNNNGLWASNAAGSATIMLAKLTSGNLIQVGSGTHVGIGGAPATSGALDIQSTDGALIVPRMTTAQKNALTAVNGMIVYDTDLAKFQGREAGAWTNLI